MARLQQVGQQLTQLHLLELKCEGGAFTGPANGSFLYV